ncbi:50S ribosomal protein L10 [Candidatus Woesearchaeota archaeon]|nr:50S ribosomal protein L10 [Candidatus Woesearchaeota archaeon]
MKAKTLGNKNARRPADYVTKAAVQKRKAVDMLVKLFRSYSVVAIVNLESLPAAQLQRLRVTLGSDLQFIMCKKSVIKLAIAAVKDKLSGIDKLAASLVGMPALLFTNQNPFKLGSTLQKSKSKAPAKPGQTAPYDIVIPAGPTSFAPGPIISELASVGIKAGVEAGKIAVKVPCTIVREGEKIKPKVAEVLAKFNIQPMEIGLNLVAALENGIIYDRKVLSVDPAAYITELITAALESRSLAVEVGFPAAETIAQLITRSARQARHVAKGLGIVMPELAEETVGKAGLEAAAIEGMIKFPADASGAGAAGKISQEFKEEIAAEKKQRESVSHDKAEELAGELKKKGTLRE